MITESGRYGNGHSFDLLLWQNYDYDYEIMTM